MLAQLFINGLVLGSIYALIGYGFGLVYWVNRTFHFGHAIVLMVAGYALYVLSSLLGWPPLLAIAGSAAVAAGIGATIEALLYRPLRQRNAPRMMYFLVAFGGLSVGSGVLQYIFGAEARFVQIANPTYMVGGLAIAANQIAMIVAAPLILLAMWLFFRTRMGIAARAVADNPERARTVGVNCDAAYFISIMIASAIAALPVYFLVTNRGTSPDAGILFMFYGVMAAFVGGIGSMPGIFLGGLLLGLSESLAIWKIPSGWQIAVAFGVLLLFILFRPTGIFGANTGSRRI